MTEETGTIQELNLNPGDVVECVNAYTHNWEVGRLYTMAETGLKADKLPNQRSSLSVFQVVSRAPDTPKTWGEMTDAEKGALLLAEHEGKVIEVFNRGCTGSSGYWSELCKQFEYFGPKSKYRIRPEPKRQMVRISGYFIPQNNNWVSGNPDGADTHRITFDTIDGKPICNTISMEKL